MKNWFLGGLLLAGVLAVPPSVKPNNPASNGSGDRWVGTWASAQQKGDPGNAPPEPGFADSTLRQVIHVSIGGKRIRVRFSNEFGNAGLKILSAHVAVSAGGSAIRPESDRPLTFHGELSVNIPAGAPMWSDPIDFDLAALSDLAVSIYVKGVPTDFTTHPGARTTSYLQAGESVSAADLPNAAKNEHWYFLSVLPSHGRRRRPRAQS